MTALLQSLNVDGSATTVRRSISVEHLPVRQWELSRSLTRSGWSASCNLTWATSIWRRADWNRSRTPLLQKCYLCVRNGPLMTGTPGRIRTCDLRIRSPKLKGVIRYETFINKRVRPGSPSNQNVNRDESFSFGAGDKRVTTLDDPLADLSIPHAGTLTHRRQGDRVRLRAVHIM